MGDEMTCTALAGAAGPCAQAVSQLGGPPRTAIPDRANAAPSRRPSGCCEGDADAQSMATPSAAAKAGGTMNNPGLYFWPKNSQRKA